MKKWTIVLAVLIAALVLVACEPETIEVTKIVEVEKEVVVTEIVEVEGKETVVEVTKIVVEKEEVIVEVTPEPEVEGPKVGGAGDVYRMAFLSDMTTLNVWAAYDPDASFWNYAVYGNFWPGLFTYSGQRFDYIPSLAADFQSDLEEEGDMWVSTVPVKEGMLWSDGSEITADDYAWTVNTVLALDLSGNWEAYDGNFLDRVEAVDAYTIKVYYHTKPGLARHQFGSMMGPIVNSAFWKPLVDPLLEQMAGLADLDPESEEYLTQREEIVQALYQLDPTGEPIAGPFGFSQWEPGAFVETGRQRELWVQGRGDRPSTPTAPTSRCSTARSSWPMATPAVTSVLEYVDGPWFNSVLFSIYNADAAVLALQADEVDFILTPNGLSRGQTDQLSGNPNVSIVENPANGFRYMAFNLNVPPLDDVAVRQAVNCMVDKNFLTQNLMQGQAIPVFTPVPRGQRFLVQPRRHHLLRWHDRTGADGRGDPHPDRSWLHLG